MFCQFPTRMASGTFDSGEWVWKPQKWFYCKSCGLYHGNRHIPKEYWNKKWKKQKSSAGVILTRYNPFKKEKEFFVVQSYHNLYSFPKGSVEPLETVQEAASRELWEETGIKHNLEGCFQYKHYISSKSKTFFLLNINYDSYQKCKPLNNTPEITSWGWVSSKDIHKLPLNKITKEILKKL